jgi:succinoglycan biosynthesis transport protein ExoP
MSDTLPLNAADVTLTDYLDLVRRRRWIILQTFAVVTAIGLITTMMATPIYRATAKLKVEAAPLTITTQNAENPLASILNQSPPDSVETQMQMLQIEPFIQRVFDRAGVVVGPGHPAPDIKVSNIDRTNVIVVQVESPSPREAERVAEAMVEQHREESLENSSSGLKRTLGFASRESRKARKALDDAEAALEEFRRSNHVTGLTAEQESQVKKFVEVETELRANESALFRTQMEIRELTDQLQKEPEQTRMPLVNENPRYFQLESQLDDLRQKRVELLQLYQETSPRVQHLDAQLDALQKRLEHEPRERTTVQRMPNSARLELRARLSAAKAEQRGLQANQEKLQAIVGEGRRLMNQWETLPIRLSRLELNRDMAEAAFKRIEEKRQELDLRNNARRPSASIIEPAAAPRAPVRPRKALNLMFACLMGLCLGVSMAFLQEFMDDRVNSPEEAERMVGLPVLGHIPMMTDGPQRLMTELPSQSMAAESYRGLRSSISFASADKPLKTLIVTSSDQGEGKSLTSVNLAIAIAMERRRVILVDADLRRPSLHRLLDVKQSPGLADLLVGKASIEDALQPTSEEDLRVIASGTRPPDPAELLNSNRMGDLIHQLSEIADVVIFDTPPCLPVTDAQVLATRVDGVVLVLEVGESKKAALRLAKGLLDQARARIVGLVFNKIGQGASQGYYYYYYTAGASYYSDTLEEEHTNGRRGRRPHALAPARTGDERARSEERSERRREADRGQGEAADDEL